MTVEEPHTTHHFTYAVLYASTQTVDDQYSPVVPAAETRQHDSTRPHGMQREMVRSLTSLWYALHLPRTGLDYRDVPGRVLLHSYDLDLPHELLLAPFPLAASSAMRPLFEALRPDLILCEDAILNDVSDFGESLGSVLEVAPTSHLNRESLVRHWTLLRQRVPHSEDEFCVPPPLITNLSVADAVTPVLFTARRLGNATEVANAAHESNRVPLSLMTHVTLGVATRVQEDGIDTPQFDRREALIQAKQELAVPIVLAAPGVPRRYRKDVLGETKPIAPLDNSASWLALDDETEDSLAENAAIRFLAAHRASASNGIAFTMPRVPDDLWDQLAQFEVSYGDSTRRPKKLQRMLRRLGNKAASLFDEDAVELVRRSSRVTCFSQFPIGLAILPGTSTPLSYMRPLTYRPLVPLTRALAQEGLGVNTRYWGRGLKLVIAECLADDDPIRPASEAAWRLAQRQVSSLQGVSVRLVFPESAKALQAELASSRPDALIISSHGFHDRKTNLSGLVIGSKRVVGPEIGLVPDLVILSACHVGPRGRGAIAISDLLLRQGATAVLSTQVPVDVRRNAVLMTRFLTNIQACIQGDLALRSVLDVWHHTASGNAVNDILQSSTALRQWSVKVTPSGAPVIMDFMSNRSAGRLRLASIYDDTETVLMEIAKETGFDMKLRAILDSHGYLPETTLYQFVGWPERLVLSDELVHVMTETEHKNSDR